MQPKKKWAVYAKVVGTKYLGLVSAATKSKAKAAGEYLATQRGPSLCHQCSKECEDADIQGDVQVEEASDDMEDAEE